MILRGLREVNGVETLVDIFDITEFTYTGKDMGERAITATIYHPSPIDFRAGDYAEFQIQSLERATGGMDGSIITEKFYIYTMPTIKKTARPMTHGQAFEHTLTLYPAQYELALVQMRDLGNRTNPDSIIYTGFDSVTFYGGAFELMERIMMVLDEAYGKGTWSYKLSNEVNEEVNDALEKFLFTFSGNTVMDALLKLNDKEGINTTFFINDRTIYVGFKRPYFCRVLDNGNVDPDIDTQMFNMRYGKTSHESIAINYGCLFDITKSVGKETPITKLFAYGAARNLNRFYCSDRIKTGRYVNRLMLPSFDADGKTDFILSEKGIEKFGIREGSKQFDDIYPSLRYVNYGDIRQIQYCIKLKVSGLDGETKDNASFPIARVQCYKVVPSTINVGVNALVECAPPEDIAVYIHTIDSVVKVVLYGGSTDADAIAKQLAHDTIVPTRTKGGTDYIPGSCFAVHDRGFDEVGTAYENADRSAWFTNPNDLESSTLTDAQKAEIQNNQVTYANTPFITDLYRFVNYNQTYFSRDGYSAWGWARLNSNYVSEGDIIAHDSLLVNEVVAVEPVVIPDTDLNIAGLAPRQQTFDIYLRDLGFKLDEQNDFGEMVFVLNGEVKVSFIDGTLGGREFNVAGKVTDFQENCICAFNDDATLNDEFFLASGYTDPYIAEKAFADGAIWRLRLIRNNLDEPNLSNLAIALPTPELNAAKGDHVVLLDLFMPDIYVHSAENRLLREAQQYLDANDNGSISYAVNFDEVRMQQIPNYALQIREGLKIRMEDADLAIATENNVKKIFEGKLVSHTSLYKTTYEEETTEKIYYTTEHRDYYDVERGGVIQYMTLGGKQYICNPSTIYFTENEDGSWSGTLYALEGMIESDYSNQNYELFADNGKITVRLLKKKVIANETGYELTDNYAQFSVSNIKKTTGKYAHGFTANCYKGVLTSYIFPTGSTSENNGQIEVYCIVEYDLKEKHTYEGTQFTPNTHLLGWGSQIYCPSKILTEFRAKKHYAIEMELHNIELFVLDPTSYPVFALINNLGDDAMIYKPTCEKMDLQIGATSVIFKFEFDTIEGFNDSQDYYPAILYKSDNKTEYIKTELLSIVESDYEGNGDLPYADFVLDSVTIQVSDNSQREVGSAPVKTISATLSEQQDASAWATLMNKVDEVAIEGEANSTAVETLVNAARKNYLSVLALKDSIFDPDGTCNQTFLQVMMMQIGADSMNYHMLKTNVDMSGISHNCRLFVDGTTNKFEAGSDTLYHYVYTQGAQGGTWEINPLSEVALDGKSVYYIALKCQRDGMNGEWVCDTAQHKVDEDATHWYFNWGILTVDSAGVYTIIETRGNAYMYGDNLICGKISDLAKKSWFDLTRGEFVLGDKGDGTAALKYVNGILTISGVASESDVASILEQVGILDSNIKNIGGKNLLKATAYHHEYKLGDTLYFTKLMNLDSGKKYIATYGKFENNAGGAANEVFNEVCLAIGTTGYLENIETVVKFGEPFEVNYNGRALYIAWALNLYVDDEKGKSPTHETTSSFTQYLDEVMVQEGEVATAFQPSLYEELEGVYSSIYSVESVLEGLDYITNALTEGSTDIGGGLVMTNLLLLRDSDNNVQAGMSGLSGDKNDNILLWGGGSYFDAVSAKNDTTDSYSKLDGKPITTLIKKDGTGKIGIFKIGEDKVEINVPNHGLISIDASDSGESGICISKGSDIRTIITDLNIEDVTTRRKSTKGVMDINFSEKDVLLDDLLEDMTSILYFNISGTPTAIELTSVKLKFYAEPASGMIPASVKYDVNGVIMVNTDKQTALWDDQYQINHSFRQSDIVNDCYECVLSFPKISRTDFIGNLRSIEISLGVGSTNTASQVFTKCDIEVEGMVWLGSTLELAKESIIVGCDGISCINGQSRFQIRNTNYGQIIIVDGLPTSSEGLKKGQLWNNNGVLSIF